MDSVCASIEVCQYTAIIDDMTSTITLSADSELCCAPLTSETIDADQADVLARTFKALSDPTRVRLVSMIAAAEGHEACVCDLTDPIGLSQPTVSHHLKILMEAGLLTRSKRGTWVYYSLVPGALDRLSKLLVSS